MKIENRREYQGALIDFKDLIVTKGWKRLLEIGKAQRKFRMQNVCLNPLEKLDGALGQEFMKGEYAGMGILMAIPETEIDKFEELLKADPKTAKEENSDET